MHSHEQKSAAIIARAIERKGIHGVHVDVDSQDVAYLDGEVHDKQEEALAVEAAIEAGAHTVVDGIHYPGQEQFASHYASHHGGVPHDLLVHHGLGDSGEG